MHFSRERIRARLHLLQESLPAALARRFFETDLLTHAAALSFYALLSLAPLLVLLLWLAASLYPSAQDELMRQVGDLAGSGARDVATTVVANAQRRPDVGRSEEHTSELQSLMRISYAVLCLQKKTASHQCTKTCKHHI